MNLNRISRKTIFAALLLITLGYQACNKNADFRSAARESRSTQTESGNGGGYDGKLRGIYVAYDPQDPCSAPQDTQIPSPNKIIEIRNGRAYKTQDRCQTVPNVALGASELKLSEHQAKSFAFEGLNFDRVEGTRPARYLENVCRGVVAATASQKQYVFDVLVRTNRAWASTTAPVTTAELLFAEGSGGDVNYTLQPTNEFTVARGAAGGRTRLTANDFELLVDETIRSADVTALIAGAQVTGTLDCNPVKVGPNLLAFSQNFLKGPWLGTTIPSNAEISPSGLAPDGLNTAYLISDTTANDNPVLIYHWLDVAPQDQGQRTFSIFVRKGTANISSVLLQHRGGTTEWNGNLVIQWAADGTATSSIMNPALDGGLIPAGNGWYRAWVTARNNGTGNYMVRGQVHPADWQQNGSGVGSVYAWGAQIENGATPSPYQATTMRY